jgi:hypothetical protein
MLALFLERASNCCGETLTLLLWWLWLVGRLSVAALLLLSLGSEDASAHAGGLLIVGNGAAAADAPSSSRSSSSLEWAPFDELFSAAASGEASDSKRAT